MSAREVWGAEVAALQAAETLRDGGKIGRDDSGGEKIDGPHNKSVLISTRLATGGQNLGCSYSVGAHFHEFCRTTLPEMAGYVRHCGFPVFKLCLFFMRRMTLGRTAAECPRLAECSFYIGRFEYDTRPNVGKHVRSAGCLFRNSTHSQTRDVDFIYRLCFGLKEPE